MDQFVINRETTVNKHQNQGCENVIAFNQQDEVDEECIELARDLTASCVTSHLIFLIHAYASHKNNRDLIKQVNQPRTQRWMRSWVHNRLTKLKSRGTESAAMELFSPLQENLKLWAVLND